MNVLNKIFLISLLTVWLIGLSQFLIYGQMAEFKPVAEEMFGSSGVSWVPKVNYSKMELTIVRPDGTAFKKVFQSGATLYISLSDIYGENYQDGYYTYELVVVPFAEKKIRTENKVSTPQSYIGLNLNNDPLTQSGGFTLKGGGIINSNLIEPGSESNTISKNQDDLSQTQDYIIGDELIVYYSTCIGNSCVNGESFGYDTLKLKENNLRIKFDDASTAGSYPNNDWQLTANDSTNGGANKFSIDDITHSKTPFTILANAPNNSIYVNSSGNFGLGTSSPVKDVHSVSGDTPTLRLEQNGSSGFAPQTWDIAGNETNFFIRDETNGSQLPFKISPGASSNSFVINSSGNIGLGTRLPSASLHIKGGNDDTGIHLETDTGVNAMVKIERPDGATSFMSASGVHGFFGTITSNDVRINAGNQWKMEINQDNSLDMRSGATCTAGGVWTNVSSREAKENIKNLNMDEAIDTLKGLTPVKFNYKAEKEEDYVGFIAEDVPELVASKDRKHLTSMDVVAVLTKVVQEQQEIISKIKERLDKIEIEKKETK